VEERQQRSEDLAQMKRLMNWWLICGWVALTPTVFAASQLDSVTIGYSSFAGAYGPYGSR
jgi:hypothetical protein